MQACRPDVSGGTLLANPLKLAGFVKAGSCGLSGDNEDRRGTFKRLIQLRKINEDGNVDLIYRTLTLQDAASILPASFAPASAPAFTIIKCSSG